MKIALPRTLFTAGASLALAAGAAIAAPQGVGGTRRPSKVDGAWVIEFFGDEGRLDKNQAIRFARTRKLSVLDADASWPVFDPTINVAEFARGWGHMIGKLAADPTLIVGADLTATTASTEFDRLGPTNGPLGFLTESDFDSIGIFGAQLDHAASEFLQRLGGDGPWDAADVGGALEELAKGKQSPKLMRLKNLSEGGRISLARFIDFSVSDLLHQIDKDKNGLVDVLEFASGAPGMGELTSLDAAQCWAALSGTMPDKYQLNVVDDLPLILRSGGEAGFIRQAGFRVADQWWSKNALDEDRLLTLDEVEKIFAPAKTSRFQPGRGILLYPSPVSLEKASDYDRRKASWWLRLSNNYEVLDENIAPAIFSWSKENGASTFRTDASIALQYRGPNSKNGLLFAHRRTALRTGDENLVEDQNVENRYFMGALHYRDAKDDSKLLGQWFRYGVLHYEERSSRSKRDSVEIEWYPIVEKHGWLERSGAWQAFSLEGVEMEWFWQPSFSADWGRTEPGDGDGDNTGFLDLTLSLGLEVEERFAAQSQFHVFTDLEELNRSFGYHESSVSWFLDKTKGFSITGSVKWGRPAPLYQDVEQYLVGFGAKF